MSTCEKCGADIPEDAENCPDCGESKDWAAGLDEDTPAADEKQADTAETAEEPVADDSADAGDEVTDTTATPITGEEESVSAGGNKRAWLWGAVAAVVLVAIGFGAWYFTRAADDPTAPVKTMMEAYAKYDMAAILKVATQDTLPKGADAQLIEQAATAKKTAGGKPALRNIQIGKVTKQGANQAKVDVTAEWLTDPAKGTYTKRTEAIVVVKKNNKWLVKLF